jgi:hypothetical protein
VIEGAFEPGYQSHCWENLTDRYEVLNAANKHIMTGNMHHLTRHIRCGLLLHFYRYYFSVEEKRSRKNERAPVLQHEHLDGGRVYPHFGTKHIKPSFLALLELHTRIINVRSMLSS